MFTWHKDSVYFSKMCGIVIKSFGFDLIPLDRRMNGQLLDAARECRSRKYPPEHAATVCISKGIRFLATKVNAPKGNASADREYARWAAIIDGWEAQGLVDGSAKSQFADAIDFVKMMASKK